MTMTNPYLDRLRALENQKKGTLVNCQNCQNVVLQLPEQSHTTTDTGFVSFDSAQGTRFSKILSALIQRCPDHVDPHRWQQAIEDGRRFLAHWDEQAEALGWTASDLFGLHEVPPKPPPSYQRLSRYDCTGLIWLLQGCPVVALTETTAAIQSPSGSITRYQKHRKPAFGPVGDTLDNFVA